MDDKQLTNAAAKRAGIALVWGGLNGDEARRADTWEYWNPLRNVEHAARLLLALKMRVDYVGDQPCIDGVLQSGMTAEESFCRAVVRAAAVGAA